MYALGIYQRLITVYIYLIYIKSQLQITHNNSRGNQALTSIYDRASFPTATS